MAQHDTSKHTLRPRPQRPEPAALRPRWLAGVALIVVAVFLAYLPALGGGFILDDDMLLTANPLIKAADGLYRFWCTTQPIDYWPVANTTLWIEWRLWGMHSAGYHVTNVALHIVEACLIWIILERLSIPGAFLAALLFAVHPVNVETVAWISQRKSVLAMLFFLLSILSYLQVEAPSPTRSRAAPPATNRWYWLSLAAFALAMLSKGSVAVLPPLLLGILWWLRPLTRRDVLRTAPFFLLAVVLVRVNVWFQTHGMATTYRSASPVERLLGAAAALWFYLYKAIAPVKLAFIYPQWHIHSEQVRWWLPLLAAVAVTAVLWWYRHGWSRPVLFAWGYFGVALVPVLGFTDVGFMKYSLVADHYQHVALIAVVGLVAAGWATWRRRMPGPARWIPNLVAVAIASTLIVLTAQQSRLYSDNMTLYQATLAENPESSMAHNNLGAEFLQSERLPQAIEHFELALRFDPGYADAHHNLGVAFAHAGQLQGAIAQDEEALRLRPDYPEAHNTLGSVLAKTGQLPQAIGHFEQAVRLKPDYPEAHYNLGLALAQTGQLQAAIAHYQQALLLKPDDPDTHFKLGIALVEAGRFPEAIGQYREALRLKPDFPEVRYKLGIVLAQTGQLPESIEQFAGALRLRPDFPEAQYNLGNALAQVGRFQDAIEHFEEALRLKPDFPEAHYDLGNALGQAGQLEAAIEHFEQALRLRPDYPDATRNLGIALAMQQKTGAGRAGVEGNPPLP